MVNGDSDRVDELEKEMAEIATSAGEIDAPADDGEPDEIVSLKIETPREINADLEMVCFQHNGTWDGLKCGWKGVTKRSYVYGDTTGLFLERSYNDYDPRKGPTERLKFLRSNWFHDYLVMTRQTEETVKRLDQISYVKPF